MNRRCMKYVKVLIVIALLSITLVIPPVSSKGQAAVIDDETRLEYTGLVSEAREEIGILYVNTPTETALQETSATYTATTNSTSTIMGDFFRYSPQLQYWREMDNAEAYVRDVLVGKEISIHDANDGDYWTCIARLPDASVRKWGNLVFTESHDGDTNCFTAYSSSGLPMWTICGSNDIAVIWYTNSQCQPTGIWEFEFFYNGSSIFSDEFELLPAIPLNPPQPDGVPYGSTYNQLAYSDPYPGGGTIAQYGCALTSIAMILSYHGTSVDPGTLNTWLQSNEGYTTNGLVKWHVAVEYGKSGVCYLNKGTNDPSILKNDICQNGPQILQVPSLSGKGTHFVVATGRDRDETTWLINDPNGGGNITLNRYGDTIDSTRRFQGPEHVFVDQYCGITIYFHSPGELLITDSLGRRTGYDPVNGIEYSEIPNSAYVSEAIENVITGELGPEAKLIDILQPLEGEYELSIIGTESGNYTLEIYAYDRENNESGKELLDPIPISAGDVHAYMLDYSREVGSEISVEASFDGKGQKPRDVNKLLSYSNPTQVRTELPEGISDFNLFIFYGNASIPASFEANLNGQDITELFSPLAGSVEVVQLNLLRGINTLVLSIDGTLASSRVAKDKDRLVFIVP